MSARALQFAFPSVGLVCLLLLVTPACGSDSVPWGHTWSSTHFIYLTRAADTEACPDLLPLLEAHAQTIHETLGLAWPTDRKVTYHRFRDQADFIANGDCPYAGACTPGTTVESANAFHRHELVHAYLFPFGFPPDLILEGAAVALSCELDMYSRPTSSWQEAYSSDPHRGGGWLVGHLLRRYGPELFLRLYARVPIGASASEFESMFNRIYPDPLETIWGQMIAAANRPVSVRGSAVSPLFRSTVP